MVLVLGGALLLGACTPTLKIEAPDKPIVLQVDLNIKHELMLRVEREVDREVAANPMIPVAKQGGWVGERLDGYLGLVREDTDAEIREFVLQVNDERQQRYAGIAEKHGIAMETVETIAGGRLIEKSAPGEYVQDAAGRWIRKDATVSGG